MHFVVDADLPRLTADLCRKYGHTAEDVRTIGLGAAPDELIAEYARRQNACILTGDFGFADIRNYNPELYHGIVVIAVPQHATADTILQIIESLLCAREIVERLPGRLAIVETGRLRIRPP
jgi:predicted nuclease of predicted toxin-antitoxin system